MDIQSDLSLIIDAAKKWGDMLEGFRERGMLVQTLKDDSEDYRRRISEAAERIQEATRCSRR